MQKEPQGNPERGKAEQVEDLGRGRAKVVVAGEEKFRLVEGLTWWPVACFC